MLATSIFTSTSTCNTVLLTPEGDVLCRPKMQTSGSTPIVRIMSLDAIATTMTERGSGHVL